MNCGCKAHEIAAERDALRKCVETQREAITDLLAEVDASRSLRKVNQQMLEALKLAQKAIVGDWPLGHKIDAAIAAAEASK